MTGPEDGVAAGRAVPRPWRLSAEAAGALARFPPRTAALSWEETCHGRAAVTRRLLRPPFLASDSRARYWRETALLRMLDWLELHPGDTWQERWKATGTDAAVGRDWRPGVLAGLAAAGRPDPPAGLARMLGVGLLQLAGADVVRPALPWLLATASPTRLPDEMALRDPEGFSALAALRAECAASGSTFRLGLQRIALVMAAKGGLARDITPGDCMELMERSSEVIPGRSAGNSPFFYELLRRAGGFPPGAPPTVRMISTRFPGQLTPEQLVGRYDLACGPVRDLLVDYLRERQPGIDYSTLKAVTTALALRFWKDLETHHPGIGSLRLPPGIAAAWKQRLRAVSADSAVTVMNLVRAFYLDLAQWALDEPARWGPWAVPCPVRSGDLQFKKEITRRKARMDQRTRERLPLLPALAAAALRGRSTAAATLEAARAAGPGELFTVAGRTLRRASVCRPSPFRVWAEDPGTGRRRDLIREEDSAFWAWAAVEVLRTTGIRIEELTELSHHSLVQYRVPATGELIPLLSVAPSKTDEERLLVISPELADVLSAVISRIRGSDGIVPLLAAYDKHECTWNPPMPLLFQRDIGAERRPVPAHGIRGLIHAMIASAGLVGPSGTPLAFTPHDFRRIFATDAKRRGVASDATFRDLREDGAVRDGGPSTAGRRSRRQSEAAGQEGVTGACWVNCQHVASILVASDASMMREKERKGAATREG